MPRLTQVDGGNKGGACARSKLSRWMDQEGHMKKLMLLLAVLAVAALPSVADAKSHKKGKPAAPPPAPEASVPIIGPILGGITKLPRMAINDMRK